MFLFKIAISRDFVDFVQLIYILRLNQRFNKHSIFLENFDFLAFCAPKSRFSWKSSFLAFCASKSWFLMVQNLKIILSSKGTISQNCHFEQKQDLSLTHLTVENQQNKSKTFQQNVIIFHSEVSILSSKIDIKNHAF